MYFPYLRGKQFEMEALLGVPSTVYRNTLPIVEPVNTSSDRFYLRIAQAGHPLLLIMNPQHPQRDRLSMATIQANLVNGPLATHPSLALGYIIDQHATLAELNTFLASNPGRRKAVIFRHTPLTASLTAIDSVLRSHSVDFLMFDDKRSSARLRTALSWHPNHVVLTDGFQKQDRNSNYPAYSAFDSNVSTWRADGLAGIGDYATIGDHFTEGGAQPRVVTLHMTIPEPAGLEAHHFSSTLSPSSAGAIGPKFAEACRLLVTSPLVVALPASTGIVMYQDWDQRGHLPRLGAAKQASLQHHIETLSRVL